MQGACSLFPHPANILLNRITYSSFAVNDIDTLTHIHFICNAQTAKHDLSTTVKLNIFWAKYYKSTLLINICQVKLVRCVMSCVCIVHCTVMINISIQTLPKTMYYQRLEMCLYMEFSTCYFNRPSRHLPTSYKC